MQWISKKSERLDVFLAKQEGILSRAKAQKLIKDGSVKVNGEITKKSALILKDGDEVEAKPSLDSSQDGKGSIKPVNLKIPVLYEDDACMVIDKPSGFAVHPAPTVKDDDPTILHGIAYLFKKQSLLFSADAVLVHRLDRETTGCLLVAKNAEAHAALQKQFEKRSVSKTYLALVAGVPDPPEAMIDAPIGRNLTDRTKMSVLKTSTSREAKTSYRTLDATNSCALLACDLHTGRTHQIRVHLSSIGHPILGDPTYHSHSSEKFTKEFAIKNLCLHAWKLKFTSPADDKEHVVEAPLQVSLKKSMKQVEITIPADRT